MSSNLNCKIYEKTPGVWFYALEQYSQRDEYDTFGPFPTFRAAENDLSRNHSNPGGCSIRPLPGCKHDLLRAVDSPVHGYTHTCDRCGGTVDKRTKEDKQKAQTQYLVKHEPQLLLLTILGKLTAAQRKRAYSLGLTDEKIQSVLAGAKTRLETELRM